MEDRTKEEQEMIDHLASQIRTLSNAINDFGDLLSSEELDPIQRQYLSEIRQAGRGLSGVIEEVLETARQRAKGGKAECPAAGRKDAEEAEPAWKGNDESK